MARPQKGGDSKRDQLIRVRCTADEKQKLLNYARSAGMTESDFIRARALNTAPITRKATPEREAFIRALGELGKVGSNINQIARALNRRAEQGELIGVSKLDIEYALNSVTALNNLLLKLLDYDHGHSR